MKAGRWGDITHTHTHTFANTHSYVLGKNTEKAQLKWQQRTCTQAHTHSNTLTGLKDTQTNWREN